MGFLHRQETTELPAEPNFAEIVRSILDGRATVVRGADGALEVVPIVTPGEPPRLIWINPEPPSR